jgi:hypothetical protein
MLSVAQNDIKRRRQDTERDATRSQKIREQQKDVIITVVAVVTSEQNGGFATVSEVIQINRPLSDRTASRRA